MSRTRRFSIAALLSTFLIALGAPAFATSPVTTSGIVTDPGGWLSDSDRSAIETAARTARTKGITIDVVVVPDFSGQKPDAWCKASATASSSKDSDILYAIAYNERSDVFCSKKAPVSQTVLDNAQRQAEATLTSNPLTASDTAIGAQTFINSVVSGYQSPSSTGSSSSRSSSFRTSSPGSGSMLVMLIIVGGGVIALLVHNNSRRSRGAGTAQTPAQAANMPGMSVAETVTLANRQLLSADEQVRSAADELDFARAQFGIAATDEFARTLEAARAAVARGFERQKQMEDATGDAEKRSMASAIMRDLGENMNPLSAVQAAFEQRRSEQATLPSRITEASERLVEQRGDLERATAELAAIAGIYPAQMLTSLQDNPEQAHALLQTAASAIEAAKQVVDTDRALAESTLDTAHRALMMAKHQTDAIFSAKSDLDAIRDRLGAAIGSISADLADVTSLRAEPTVFDPLVADARAAIAEGQASLMNNGDPLAALEHLRTSEANIDAALAPLRSQRENAEKARANAQAQISLAETAFERAERYVQGRRGAIDLSVRSTLHDSEQSLKAARAAISSDPAKASALASDARAKADSVLATPLPSAADSWNAGYSGRPTSPGSSIGSSLGEALLWSILFSNTGSSSHHHRSRWDDNDSWSSGSSWSGSSGGSSDSGWTTGSGRF
ncbi:TPM domain-containing protein [uncultured Actinomyces sp.]|uniref:TPM domain-containing protein n=1 Tax=uncultured Actinomyces sp. TaxID=249061 RepID=UPI0028EF274A|nr:TPM domain-containing protein [uncultured Actinomyces sp.]